MNESSDYLLVVMSSSFADSSVFKNKVDLYVSNMVDFHVVAVNDVNLLAKDYFGELLSDSRFNSISLGEKRKLVNDAKWVVLFWDGTSISDFVYLSALYGKKAKLITVSTTRVVNKERGEDFDIYIGRGTPWGNPFVIGDNGADRAATIKLYKEYFQKKFVEDAEGNKAIRSLRGKVLGCHCKPAACHGDIISAYLNKLVD
jgi:hypothetical protein